MSTSMGNQSFRLQYFFGSLMSEMLKGNAINISSPS